MGCNHRAEAILAIHSQGQIPFILHFLVQGAEMYCSTTNWSEIIIGSVGCTRTG